MRIAYDLDGVLRHIHQFLQEQYDVPDPQTWDWVYKRKNVFDWCKEENYRCLREAPVTEYFNTILKFNRRPEIWTAQPELWKKPTREWIRKHIGKYSKVIYLSTADKRKELDKQKDMILVEDNPNMTHYDRILLISRPYNQKVKTNFRIKSPKELDIALRAFSILDYRKLTPDEITYGKTLEPLARKYLGEAHVT